MVVTDQSDAPDPGRSLQYGIVTLPGLLSAFLLTWTISIVVGCGVSFDQPPSETDGELNKAKIVAESSLFDVTLYRQKQKNSFRLEVYVTDSLAGLAGRGYLGKGALKGWLDNDSLAIWFPSTNEYLYESTNKLFSRFNCIESTEGIDLLRIFSGLPDYLEGISNLNLTRSTARKGREVYVLVSPGCDWSLKLVYDMRKPGYRLYSFDFEDGKGNRLKGKRRKFKARSKVSASRLTLSVPFDAQVIRP